MNDSCRIFFVFFETFWFLLSLKTFVRTSWRFANILAGLPKSFVFEMKSIRYIPNWEV
jgi:hypothetical protein